ncbi:acetate--CoA ligase family protein [Pontivivens nitratireducens]|uniref:Acetate--CoA ligase family protein n=1 Tax=Pontivivens nitratireducens TaxID=2758038 RepID=A0A6G7VR94_9RHOB|nr:acetate--CoA ligase family protein [Pontibrevibacter nitratireducens]QIK42531.1 acetate--CoA ligase family protein [Pontibrevibacter nitratireducens]
MTFPDPNLDHIFRPRSVAIVGASNDPSRISGRPLRYLKERGYKGKIYPINPTRDVVQGMKAWPSLADLPEAPDVAILAIPSTLIPGVLRDGAVIGLKGAIIMSSGFAEAGEEGAVLQAEITAIAQETGIRILGPNCVGLFSTNINFYGTFTQSIDRDVPPLGGVAVVSQSGAYGGYIAYLASQRGLGINYWVTTGNEADLEVGECIAWLAGRDDVKVIALYLEGVRKGPAFREGLARARAAGKPVIAMKVGRSAAGEKAAQSHTASMAGSDDVYDAIFRDYGVYRATTTEEQLDIAEACLTGPYPVGRKLGILTLSGGVGVQMCDAAEVYGLDVATMPEDAGRKLKKLLPFAAVGNPIDTTAQVMNDMSLLSENIRIVLEEGGYDMIVFFLTTTPAADAYAIPIRDAILKGLRGQKDKLVVLCMGAREEIRKSYREMGFLVYQDADRAVQIAGALTHFGQAFATVPRHAPVPLGRRVEGTGPMSEHAAKKVLASAGVPFLTEVLATTAEEAAKAAKTAGGPVAMKVASPDIQHKTEIGGVALNVATVNVRAAFHRLTHNVAEKAPDATLEGILVAPMAPKGIEVIVGTITDAVFGPVVMFGMGGILVELVPDVTFQPAPFDLDTAREMVARIKAAPLFDGYRGAPKADTEALAQLLSNLSLFAAANAGTLQSIDLNPVLVLEDGKGVVALDAVVERRSA